MAAKTEKTTSKLSKSIVPSIIDKHIVFDGNMRKVFVEGIVQDVKEFFESKTNGSVEVTYEDYALKGHEFGFKLYVVKSAQCKKQMFSEATSAIINIVNYMLPGGDEQYDITMMSEDGKLEIKIVSNW